MFIRAAIRLRWFGHVVRMPEKRVYPTTFWTGSLNMARDPEAGPERTGSPVSLRMQLYLQVSIT